MHDMSESLQLCERKNLKNDDAGDDDDRTKKKLVNSWHRKTPSNSQPCQQSRSWSSSNRIRDKIITKPTLVAPVRATICSRTNAVSPVCANGQQTVQIVKCNQWHRCSILCCFFDSRRKSMGTMCATHCMRPTEPTQQTKNTPPNTSHTPYEWEWQRVSSYAVQENDVSTCHPYSGVCTAFRGRIWKNYWFLIIFGFGKFVAANGRRSEWMLDESIRFHRH